MSIEGRKKDTGEQVTGQKVIVKQDGSTHIVQQHTSTDSEGWSTFWQKSIEIEPESATPIWCSCFAELEWTDGKLFTKNSEVEVSICYCPICGKTYDVKINGVSFDRSWLHRKDTENV